MAFLEAHKLRWCRDCKKQYTATAEIWLCPSCGERGQRMFDHLTMIAGRRFGKSRFGSLACVEEATLPNSIGWACAPTNPKLHRYVIPAFQKLIPTEWVKDYSSEFQDLRLKNGSLIHFQTLEDPDQGRGQGLDWLWIDEVCELTKKHWEVIAPSLGEKQGAAIFTTSPRSYDWVYEAFYKPAMDSMPGFWALHAKTSDNPLFQTVAGKEWLDARRETMSPEMFRQEHEADFVTFTGAVYGNLLETQILRNDEQVKQYIPEWPRIESWREIYMGIDTGADHPFGSLKVVSTEKGMIVVGEYLERHKSFVEHKSAMLQLAASSNVKWAINKNERQPMIELAQPPNRIVCNPAENDQVAGIERVKSWLYQRQLWFVESQVPRTLQQMRAYRYDDNYSPKDDQKRKEQVYKKNDELPDCLRYICMIYPRPARSAPVIEVPKRDLSSLPPDMRAAIERMRRIEEEPKAPTMSSVAPDFWS